MAATIFKYLLVQILINILSVANGTPTEFVPNTHVASASTGNKNVAELLEKLMNPNLDPCNNFYRFACGGIGSSSSSPPVLPPNDEIENDINLFIMKNLDENSDKGTDEISLIKNAKNMYQACKNARKMRKNNVNTLLDIVNSIGGWPVLKMDTWNETLFDWKRTIYTVNNNNNETIWDNIFFPFKAVETEDDSIYFPVPSLGLEQNLLKDENKKQLHDDNYSEMERMLHDLGGNKSNVTEELNKIIDFEIKFAKILSKYNISSEEKEITLGKLMGDYPFYQWQEYIQHSFPSNIQIDYDQKIIFENYDNIEELYNFIERTDKKILANYIIWRQFSDIWKKTIDNIDYREEISSVECSKVVNEFLPVATGVLYVRNYYDDSSRIQMMKNVTRIANNVKNAFIKMIENATWMNNITRKSAIKKVESIRFKIGYPPEILNNTILDEYNGDLKTNKSNYVETLMSVTMWKNKDALKKLKQPSTNDQWEFFATIITYSHAYHDDSRREIMITAGTLRGIYYDNNHPQYMIYGTLGVEIGHDLAHSLDSTNRQYNSKGEMISWWTEFDNAQYNYRLQCLDNQYKSFVDIKNELREKESLTQNQDIADNVGLKAAYFAYKNLNIKEKNQILHGKSYTPDQMFWISSASQYGSMDDKLEIKLPQLILDENDHSPNELRVLGPFSNMKQFSEDFMCPDNSPMNPYTKCVIW